jgi:predicted ArsR family transcriptional regulator
MSYSVKYERPGSGRSTIRRFFADNPDEELTLKDIALKAGISEESARALVSVLKEQGLIESVRVYRAAKK